MHPIAARRIIRLAFGTALALFVSQAVGWSVSFVTPVLVSVLLSLPLPRFKLKQNLAFMLALLIPLWASLLLLPLLKYQQLVGFILLFLAIYWSFYYSASGGKKILGSFMTMGLAIVTAIGSDSVDAVIIINLAVSINAVLALLFVQIAFALFPDHPFEGKMPAAPPQP